MSLSPSSTNAKVAPVATDRTTGANDATPAVPTDGNIASVPGSSPPQVTAPPSAPNTHVTAHTSVFTKTPVIKNSNATLPPKTPVPAPPTAQDHSAIRVTISDEDSLVTIPHQQYPQSSPAQFVTQPNLAPPSTPAPTPVPTPAPTPAPTKLSMDLPVVNDGYATSHATAPFIRSSKVDSASVFNRNAIGAPDTKPSAASYSSAFVSAREKNYVVFQFVS